MQPPTPTQSHHPPQTQSVAKTWQVIVGFLTAGAIVLSGLMVFTDRAYVDKDTYNANRQADREERIKQNAEMKAAVGAVTTSADELKKSVEKLNNKLEGLNLTGPNRRRR